MQNLFLITRSLRTAHRSRLRLVEVLVLALALVAPGAAHATNASRGTEPATQTTLQLTSHEEFDAASNIISLDDRTLAVSSFYNEGPSSFYNEGPSDADAGIRTFSTATPARPQLLSFLHCPASTSHIAGDAKVIASSAGEGNYPGCDSNTGITGVRILDASNPRKMKIASFLETKPENVGAHTLTFLPGLDLVYISTLGPLQIIDVSDPGDPKLTRINLPDATYPDPQYATMENRSGIPASSPGCHEIGLDLTRRLAFCAGVTETQIWDIRDPFAPVVIAIIKDPRISHHHSAEIAPDGRTLVLSDETQANMGFQYGCAGDGTPTGALWFYDLSDPASPRYLSYWAPQTPLLEQRPCTAHNYAFFPDRDWVAVTWYAAGLFILDYSDREQPRMIAHYSHPKADLGDVEIRGEFLYATSFSPVSASGENPALAGGGGLYTLRVVHGISAGGV